ncbi:MAG: hypothetical protein HQ522_00580 [Bacteroidetes bacterium]|nr:hypothetical protein [Bacteroidota bacterium]
MNDTLLYTLPQWFIFAGIFVVTYGWVEDKKPFRIIGATILVILGIYSLFVLTGDYFASGNFLTPEEIASEELDDEIIDEIPFQVKLIPAYWSFVVGAILAMPAIFLDIKNNKKYRLFILLSGLVCLFGFFVIIGAIRML